MKVFISWSGTRSKALAVALKEWLPLILQYAKPWVSDKDISSILSLLPKDANYVFCQANIPRALPAIELMNKAKDYGLNGVMVNDVNAAMDYAFTKCNKDDLIYVGGSTFVVAEINSL